MIGWPIDKVSVFEVDTSDPTKHGVRLFHQRFNRATPYRYWKLQYGPSTYAALSTEILSVIRGTFGGALQYALTLPNEGSIYGYFDDDIEWTINSPTACFITVGFRSAA